jgi:hypothetical protein
MWECKVCHMTMSVASRSRHLSVVHRYLNTEELNIAFGPGYFVTCPFEGCGAQCMFEGLATHWGRKHKGHQRPVAHVAPQPPPPPPPVALPPPPPPPLAYHENLLQLVAAVGANVDLALNNNIPPAVIPVPVAAQPEPPLVPIDLGLLVARFRYGLYRFHPTWKTPLLDLLCLLLDAAQSESLDVSTRAIAALQLLPGLIEFSRRKQKNVPSPINVLRAILACPDRVAEIIRLAVSWNTAFVRRPVPAHDPPNKEHLRARIELLISQNRLSAAAKLSGALHSLMMGEEPPPPPDPIHMSTSISRLHPIDDERDVLPPVEDDPADCLQLTPDQIRHRIYRLNCDSSSGSTGWTNILLRRLCDDRDSASLRIGDTPPLPVHLALTAFFNKMLRGEILGEGQNLLVTARLIMLPKGPESFRPLRIECALMRLFSAAACDVARPLVATSLRPQQLGGGLRGGVEFGARLLDIGYDQGDAILSIDVENAFNSARHTNIYQEIWNKVPAIARIFRWKYGAPSIMRDNHGAIVAHTRTGVGQGDPWGSLFFEIGLQPVLLRLQVKMREIEATYNLENPHNPITRPGLVSAYEDDTSVRAETPIIWALASCVEEIFGDFGFKIKAAKSLITGRDVDFVDDPPEDFVISSDGIVALGTPIGRSHYRTATSSALLSAMSPPHLALSLLTPRTSILLLLKCFSVRPSFLMRTATDPSALRPAAAAFDTEICNCLATILHLEPSEDLKTRAFLPRRHGGLGFTRQDSIGSEKNQIASRLAFQNFLSSVYPMDFQYTLQQQHNMYWSPIKLGDCENLGDYTDLTTEELASMTHANCRTTLSTAVKTALAKQSDLYHTSLCAFPATRHISAWFLSSSVSSTSFISSTTGIDASNYFPPSDFVCAVRAFLGYGHSNALPAVPSRCSCGKMVCPSTEQLHTAHCSANRAIWTHRHNDIRDCFGRLLRKMYPNNVVSMEKVVGKTAPDSDGVAHDVVADIALDLGPEVIVIDFAVVSPGASLYMEQPTESPINQDGAAKHMERNKRSKYAKIAPPSTPPPASVIPFVIEASGRLGPAAISFLLRICPTQTFLRTHFLNEISLICARALGKMLRIARDSYRRALPQGP